MDQTYYDAVTKMEQSGVDEQYMVGWMSGYLRNPKVEEQRISEAYDAGYTDGENKDLSNIGNWVKET